MAGSGGVGGQPQALADESAYPTNQCIDSLRYDDRLAAIADKVSALARSDQTSPEMFGLDRAVAGAGEAPR